GSLAERLAEVRGRIADAAARSGRTAADVLLVAVTKHAGPEQIRELLKLGVGDLGENRVQQLQQRAGQLGEFHSRALAGGDKQIAPKLRWHMIGHLQRNKVKPLLPHASMIQSVDSLRLAEELETQLEKSGKKLPILLQVNASEESQKGGVAVGAAAHLAEQIATMEHVQIAGVMTMAALDADERQTRHTFARTREIFDEMRKQKIGGAGLKYLSMGMTNDYEWAIQEGANVVRVGSALFGGKPDDHVDEEE
ncbi:YggS family pyridoxal phosphate-dependent enzyme, partial [bacterium]